MCLFKFKLTHFIFVLHFLKAAEITTQSVVCFLNLFNTALMIIWQVCKLTCGRLEYCGLLWNILNIEHVPSSVEAILENSSQSTRFRETSSACVLPPCCCELVNIRMTQLLSLTSSLFSNTIDRTFMFVCDLLERFFAAFQQNRITWSYVNQ